MASSCDILYKATVSKYLTAEFLVRKLVSKNMHLQSYEYNKQAGKGY